MRKESRKSKKDEKTSGIFKVAGRGRYRKTFRYDSSTPPNKNVNDLLENLQSVCVRMGRVGGQGG